MSLRIKFIVVGKVLVFGERNVQRITRNDNDNNNAGCRAAAAAAELIRRMSFDIHDTGLVCRA